MHSSSLFAYDIKAKATIAYRFGAVFVDIRVGLSYTAPSDRVTESTKQINAAQMRKYMGFPVNWEEIATCSLS